MKMPVDPPYRITMLFGVPDTAAKFGRHAGIDLAVASGTKVYAPVGGVVTDYTYGEYHGNTVQIYDGRYYYRLMHNSRIFVMPGQVVKEGDLVASSGATGKGITGPHVHFDISPSKIPALFNFINPSSLLGPSQGGNMPTDEEIKQISQRTGASVEELKNKTDWRDVVFAVLIPKIEGLDAELLKAQKEGPTPKQVLADRILDEVKQYLSM